MRYAVFVSTVPLDDENEEPDGGISIVGMQEPSEIAQEAREAFAELNANEGVSDPWLVDEEQLAAIEAALPKEKTP